VCSIIISMMYKNSTMTDVDEIEDRIKGINLKNIIYKKSYFKILENSRIKIQAILLLDKIIKKRNISSLIKHSNDHKTNNTSMSLRKLDVSSTIQLINEDISEIHMILSNQEESVLKKCNQFTIHREINTYILHNPSIKFTKKNYQFEFSERKYYFYQQISAMCSYLIIIPNQHSKIKNLMLIIRVWTKELLTLMLIGITWYYISVFCLSIYQQYGNNFVKISVMPLFSIFVMQWVIIANLMSLIAFLLMKNRILFLKNKLLSLVYLAFVPPLSERQYKLIQQFKNIAQKI
jgi:hypothetical protein